MQIMIEIPDIDYYNMINDGCIYNYEIRKALENSIPLPKGHGRLIDADALSESFELSDFSGDEYDCIDNACYIVGCAPTIIEAEVDTDDY